MANTARGAARPEGTVGHQHLGAQVRAERQRRALSVRELARRIGVSASLISQVETGRAQPSVTTLMALVTELELSLDSLFSDGVQTGRPDAGRARQLAGPWRTDGDGQGWVQAPEAAARRSRKPS